MDKIDCIKTFIEVVKAGNFSAASRKLSITRDQVAKRICFLETLFNTSFFIRDTRKMHLTSVGEKFYEHALLIINEFEQAEHQIAFEQKYPEGKLKIAIPYFFKSFKIEEIIANFLINLPNIELDICFTEKFQPIDEHRYDIIFKILSHKTELKKTNDILLKVFNFHFYASKDYYKRYGTPKNLNDLNHHNLIIYSNDFNHTEILDKKIRETIYLNPQLICNDESLLLNICQNNQSIAILPDYIINQDSSLISCLESCHFDQWSLYITPLYRDKIPKKTEIFLNHVLSYFDD